MTTTDLQVLFNHKQVELLADEQDCQTGLRLLLTDAETGEVGVLACEPTMLALPDEATLSYSYQAIQAPPTPHFEECGYVIKTRVGPDFPANELPF